MEDILENKLICRICLKVVDQTQQSYGNIEDETGTLRDMMLCCIPEMDIYVSLNPILCFPCIQTLVGLYNFKTKCINTETIIKTYMQRHNISEFGNVNLTCVVRDLIQINNFQRQMQDKKGQEPKKNDVINRTVEPNRTKERADDVSKVASEQPPPIEERVSSTAASSSEETPMENESQQPVKESRETSEVLSSVKESSDCQNSGALKNTEVQNGSGSVGMKEGASVHPKSEKSDKEGTDGEVVTISKDDIYRETDEEDSSMQSSSGPNSSLQDGSLQESSIQTMETDQIVLSTNPVANHKLPHEPTPNNIYTMNYQCFNCAFVTDASEEFIRHRETCKDIKEKVEYKCPHCSYVTTRRYVLTQHVNSQHTKEIWYQCTSCDYKCTDKSYLKKHAKIHVEGSELEEKVCEYCDFRTLSDYNFRKHLSKHDIQVLQCEFCSYSSNDRTNFRRHLFTHNPIPSDCDFCDYKSVSPYHMRNHLKKYHNGVGVEDLDLRKDQPIMELVDEIRAAVKDANQIRV